MPGGRCGRYPGIKTSGPEYEKKNAQAYALYEISREREAQDKKWGFPQRNTYCEWSSILAEEVGELAKELNELNFGRGDRARMRAEAVQVAAVAISILTHDGLGTIEEVMAQMRMALEAQKESEAAKAEMEPQDGDH